MPQPILPLLPEGATPITDIVSVYRSAERWTYFLGINAIFSHAPGDLRSFRMIIGQLVCEGTCRQVDIHRAFGVPERSISRSVRRYRTDGVRGFFKKQGRGRGGKVLSKVVLVRAQELLDGGLDRTAVAKELGIKRDTLRKAINDGRLYERANEVSLTKSYRSTVDAAAADGMGTACTRVEERIFASFGMLDGAPVRFESCLDVTYGSVLSVLPALLENGLLAHLKCLGNVRGYYQSSHIILLLGFMALCRIKTTEQVRGKPSGELGKMMGLDRIPEVRCLRHKMDELSRDGAAETWAGHLSRQWMEADPDRAGVLYVDGHVRVYYGGQTKLPRKYVSRERLCLRGVTDYWVNDAVGRPFFVVEQVVDPGLLSVLRESIVSRLLKEVPNQPSETELQSAPFRCRFVLVFDREGYSPGFFREMWQTHRIACISYHKYPDKNWPEEWFTETESCMANGEIVSMKLAEAGTLIGSGADQLWVREIRKLTDSGHQTSVISTTYEMEIAPLAAAMFTRWCQENFFRYMMEHFEIDLLCEYETESFPDTQKVVNPKWRQLDRDKRSLQSKLTYRNARFASLTLNPKPQTDMRHYLKWEETKAQVLEEIEQYDQELTGTKARLKETPKHITWAELDEQDKFQKLVPNRKRLLDTVRMIAYRAETAMAVILRPSLGGLSQARAFLRDLFLTEADILPEPSQKLLRIRVHHAARPAADRATALILKHLNETETIYPGTEMTMQFELSGTDPPNDKIPAK